MFNIHDYIMKTLRGMVGHYPDFQIAEVESWFEPVEEPPTEEEGE